MHRFISQLVDKFHPFTHFLKKDQSFKWDPICQSSFEIVKKYLENPPNIYKKTIDPIHNNYMNNPRVLLAQLDDNGKERSIYYIIHTLVSYELNYSSMVVVFSTQKLHRYMLSHIVKIISKIDTLKYILSWKTLTGHLTKWVMLLSEFDIQSVYEKVVKGQVIPDQWQMNL